MNNITPRYIAQQIIRLVEAGDQSRDSQLTERDVLPLIKQTSSRLLRDEIYRLRQDPEGEKTIPSQFIKTFRKIPVKKRTFDGVNYIDLPGDYAGLPNNEGVRRIAPETSNPYQNKAMIPVQHEQMDVYEGILGSMQKQWVYFIEGDKAIFYKRCGKTLCESDIKYVTTSLVHVSADVDDDMPLSLPSELQIDMIKSILDVLQVTYGLSEVKDMLNDNNADAA